MNKEKWARALDKEFIFHERNALRKNDNKWTDSSKKLLSGLGLDLKMEGKTILDAGCGSRLRTKELSDKNRIIGIDPLADKYKHLEFSDLSTVEYYSLGLEERVDHLSGIMDVALCLNVLDHCVNPRKVMKNVFDYLKPGGEFYLWTDLGHLDDIHEGNYSATHLEGMIVGAGFKVHRMTEGLDPYEFSTKNEPNDMRCGAPCAPGITCVCVYASKPDK